METLKVLLLSVHVIACLFIILFVLMQPSKSDGAMGTAFGGDVTGHFLGAQTVPWLAKWTRNLMVSFFVTSLILACAYAGKNKSSVVREALTANGAATAPAITAPENTDNKNQAQGAAATTNDISNSKASGSETNKTESK